LTQQQWGASAPPHQQQQRQQMGWLRQRVWRLMSAAGATGLLLLLLVCLASAADVATGLMASGRRAQLRPRQHSRLPPPAAAVPAQAHRLQQQGQLRAGSGLMLRLAQQVQRRTPAAAGLAACSLASTRSWRLVLVGW
jgi:hypothetical protein